MTIIEQIAQRKLEVLACGNEEDIEFYTEVECAAWCLRAVMLAAEESYNFPDAISAYDGLYEALQNADWVFAPTPEAAP